MILLLASALAWETMGATWPDEAFPLPYAVSGSVSGVTDDELLAAVDAAFATWSEVSCAELSFQRVDHAGGAWGTEDGQNTVYFFATDWPEAETLLSAPLGVTAGDELVEVDLAVNAEHFTWVVDGADGTSTFDLQAVVTHEIGHLLGLWHSDDEHATLNPSEIGQPDARELAEDDIEGLCALYGESVDPGDLGDACEQDDDCASGICLADAGEQYCSETCATDTCPEGNACLSVDGEDLCARGTGCGCGGTGLLGAWPLALFALARRRRG